MTWGLDVFVTLFSVHFVLQNLDLEYSKQCKDYTYIKDMSKNDYI